MSHHYRSFTDIFYPVLFFIFLYTIALLLTIFVSSTVFSALNLKDDFKNSKALQENRKADTFTGQVHGNTNR